MYKTLALTLLLLFVSMSPAASQEMGDVLIKNGTVLTITNGTLTNTDVLIQDGKITRIGPGLSAPRGVRVIDASDQYVMPGIIDAHSHIALSSVNEPTSPVTSEVTMEDVIDPFDVGIYRALAGGVTTIHVMHGSANVIGGQCETLKLRYGSTFPDDLKMEGRSSNNQVCFRREPNTCTRRRQWHQPIYSNGCRDGAPRCTDQSSPIYGRMG